MSIFQKIRRVMGTAQIKEAISDPFIYKDNKKSFAGNTLEGSNVLIVTNCKEASSEVMKIKELLDTEKCNFRFIYVGIEEFCISQIEESVRNFIGRVDHIINILDVNILHGRAVMQIYKCLQTEAKYAIDKICRGGGICVTVRYDSNTDPGLQAEINAISKAVNGLGMVMADHDIIVNGAVIQKSVPLEDELATVIFLCSKYGQILAGEVLEMS